MSTFSNVVRGRTPERSIVLKASAWAHEYKKRPGSDVAVGLRLLPEADIQMIKREAVKYALDLYSGEDGRPVDLLECTAAYNDALVRWVVGRSCCDPNDIDTSFFDQEEETVRRGLTSDGARWLFDEYNRFRVETSPSQVVATPDDLGALSALLLTDGSFDKLTQARRLCNLKLLRAVLDELRDPTGAQVDGDDVIINDED